MGLCHCLGFSLVAASRGHSIVVHRLLAAAASLVAEHSLRGMRAQQLWLPGSVGVVPLVAPLHVGSSQIRD